MVKKSCKERSISGLMAPRQKYLKRIITLKGKHRVHAGCLFEFHVTQLKMKIFRFLIK